MKNIHNRVITFLFLFILLTPQAGFCETLQEKFDSLCKEWEDLSMRLDSVSGYPGGKTLKKISQLGADVFPLVIEKMKTELDNELVQGCFKLVLIMITKYRPDVDYKEFNETIKYRKRIVDRYEYWWLHERKKMPSRFQTLYNEWRKLKAGGDLTGSEKKLDEIRRLGFIAVPMILDKIQDGDREFLPIVSLMFHNDSLKTASAEECIEWCEKNREKWYIEIPKDDEAGAK